MDKNFMGNIFIEDYELNKKYTYISQISILTIKSLIPSIDDLGVRINYKRFTEELNLWKDYRVGENPSLLTIDSIEPNIYWNGKDDSIFSRIVPIVIANKSYEPLEEEIIRNILFTSGNLREMFEYISIAYILYLIYNKEKNVVETLKDRIIRFGQIDFLDKYENDYKISINHYPGNYKVDFEKEKIHIISLVNGVDTGKYPYLSDCIGVLDKVPSKTSIGMILYNFLYGNDIEHNLPVFYLNLGTYLINLRKSRIDPKNLDISEYILPDIFTYNEGENFFHSLLRDSKIIKKEVRDGFLTSLVQTRTGIYVFRKIDL